MTLYRLDNRLVTLPTRMATGFGMRVLDGPDGVTWYTDGSSAWKSTLLSPVTLKWCEEKHKIQRDPLRVDLFVPHSLAIKMVCTSSVNQFGAHLLAYESTDGRIVRFVDDVVRPPKVLWLSASQRKFPDPSFRSEDAGESMVDRSVGRLRPSESERNDIMIDSRKLEESTFFTTPYSVTPGTWELWRVSQGRISVDEVTDPETRLSLKYQNDDAAAAAASRTDRWIDVPDSARAALDRKLKKLERLAAKVGAAPPTLEEGEAIEIPVKNEQGRTRFFVSGRKLRLLVPEAIKFSGDFEVLARIENIGEGANTVRAFGKDDAKLPQELWSTKMLCEHCNKIRARKAVYYVEDLASGERKIIGSACVDDFTGHPGMESLAASAYDMYLTADDFFESIEEEEEFKSGGAVNPSQYLVPVDDILAHTILVVRASPSGRFISRAEAERDNKRSTTDDVSALLFDDGKGAPVPRPTAVEIEQANVMLEWAKNLTAVGEFESNIRSAASVKNISGKKVGLVCAILPAYERAMGAATRTKAREAESQRVMTMGDPYRPEAVGEVASFLGTLEFQTSYDTNYGTTHVLKFKDETGRTVVWRASRNPSVSPPKFAPAQLVDEALRILSSDTIEVPATAQEKIARVRNGEDLLQRGLVSPEKLAELYNTLRTAPEGLVTDPSPEGIVDYTTAFTALNRDEILRRMKAKDAALTEQVKGIVERHYDDMKLERGVPYQVTGKIKSKAPYNGEPQTEIQRATITMPPSVKASMDRLSAVVDNLHGVRAVSAAAARVEEAYALLDATTRDQALVVHIPLPNNLAKLFPDRVYNHGHMPHATVCFVTKDPTPTISANVVEAVRYACRRIPPFVLKLDVAAGLQDFGDGRDGEKALWFSLLSEPNGVLSYLHRVIRQGLADAGLPCEAHDTFRGHVTWRYVQNDIPMEDRLKLQSAAMARFPGDADFTVRSVSVSTPEGERVCLLNPTALVPLVVTQTKLAAAAKPKATVKKKDAKPKAKKSDKPAHNARLTELYWAGRKGKDISDKVSDALEEAGLIRTVKSGKKLTKKGVEAFAKISKKKKELVEKGVRNH